MLRLVPLNIKRFQKGIFHSVNFLRKKMKIVILFFLGGQATLWSRHFEIFWPLARVGLQLGWEIMCLFDRLLVIPVSASLMILYEMNLVNRDFFFINIDIVNVGVGAFHALVICGTKCEKWYFVTIIVLTYCEKKLF